MEERIKQTINIIDATSTIKIISKPLLCSKYKTAVTIKIDPEDFDWNYRSLSVFVNEITGFKALMIKMDVFCKLMLKMKHIIFSDLIQRKTKKNIFWMILKKVYRLEQVKYY